MDVVAEIKPAGPSSHYMTRLPRLENGEKRSLAHTSFTDRDYVPFSARTAKPTRIIVTREGHRREDLQSRAALQEVTRRARAAAAAARRAIVPRARGESGHPSYNSGDVSHPRP